MAEFVAPQFQNPDILGSYVRGRMGVQQLQANQQQTQLGGLQIDQLKMTLDRQGKLNNLYDSILGQTQGGAAQPQTTGGGNSGGIQNGPQGAVAQNSPQNSSYGNQGSDGTIGGMQPSTVQALGLLQGKDPLETATGIQNYQIKQRQMQADGPISLLDSVTNSASPARIVMNNPGLMQRWQQMAPQMGLDPVKDFTDDNVRQVATLARNNIAGQAGLPTVKAPDQMQTTQGALGSIYQTDPITHKITQVKAEEPLKDVIGPDGTPTNVRASAAEGKQPFNQSIFGANALSDQALQFAADTYRTTGKMPASFGRSPAMQAKVLDKVASDAAATGDTTGAIVARAGALKANGMALDQTTKLESATTSYYNTLDKNLNNLQDLAGKVDSTGSPLINKVYRAWQQGVAGDPEVAKYVTYLNAVEGEYAKIQSGSLGNAPTSDAAKRDAKDVINKFMSQGQISAVADAMRTEGNNRLSSIREQKTSLTQQMSGGAPGAAGATPAPPSTAASPPTTNAQGWTLHTDKNGNQAYVSPDGKSFQEVKK